MEEQRKYAILFAATILAARKLNESGNTPWAVHVAITEAIEKAKLIREKIDERSRSGRTCVKKLGIRFADGAGLGPACARIPPSTSTSTMPA